MSNLRTLYDKNNQIYRKIIEMKKLKINPKISAEKSCEIENMIKEEFKKYRFYKNLKKIGGKIYGEKICIKSR